MKKRTLREANNPSTFLPISIMAIFSVLLLISLFLRVYFADRDLAITRRDAIQSAHAAEAGIHYAANAMQTAFESSSFDGAVDRVNPDFFDQFIEWGAWKKIGSKTDSWFRINMMKKISAIDIEDTPMIDESMMFQIESEGRCGKHFAKSTGIINVLDLVTRFAVINALNDYYYGQPIGPWIEKSDGLSGFMKANQKMFESGILSMQGVCHDPTLLYNLFCPEGADPFAPIPGKSAPEGNFGKNYSREGSSPCMGPLYCQTPIVVDSHTFSGPVQTALYFYRRNSGKPKINISQNNVALPSSRRVQIAADSLEGELPKSIAVDIDSQPKSSFIRPWRPNFLFLRQYAKEQGIYIDENGKGFLRGKESSVPYYPDDHILNSEEYFDPILGEKIKDHSEQGHIVLSTSTSLSFNNIDSYNLGNSRILFSERPIFLRGDIGNDLVIVTPRQIFITGPTNVDYPKNLFLIAGEGVAVSVIDLEEYILANNPDEEFINAAKQWIIKAVIYKPGAGVYSRSNQLLPSSEETLVKLALMLRRDFELTIQGACLEGTLQRWIHSAKDGGVKVKWEPTGLDLLPIRAVSANLIRIRTEIE